MVRMILFGFGTAMVYPTFLGAVADQSAPASRASAVGVFRLWRDSGFALGALAAGVVADHFSPPAFMQIVAALTGLSGALVALTHREDSSHDLGNPKTS